MADDSTGALPYVALARRNVKGGAQAVRLDVAESHCMLLSGNAAGALRHAAAADRAAEVLGNERRRGTALRVIALAQHRLGMQADACQTILQTVSLIERHGSRGSLALALRMAAQITGRPEYMRRVMELWPMP